MGSVERYQQFCGNGAAPSIERPEEYNMDIDIMYKKAHAQGMRESPESIHARKAALIAGIAAGQTVIEAAAQSGIGWRRAYVWRAEDSAFRAAWDKARAQIKARVPESLDVPPSPAPDAPMPAFTVPPSPPLPPRWHGRPPKPPITVIIEPLADDDVLDARERLEKQSTPRTDDNGVY